MEDEEVCRLIISIRNKWGSRNYNFERCIRSLGMALFRCSDNMATTVQAMIEEASTRQLYQALRPPATAGLEDGE